ncbi:MAG TPA: hypothetical protein DD706_13150, partial [Nitrospiraceae bacterium]|nr:hypothetical protein [Nitrospiraceae bacterium]
EAGRPFNANEPSKITIMVLMSMSMSDVNSAGGDHLNVTTHIPPKVNGQVWPISQNTLKTVERCLSLDLAVNVPTAIRWNGTSGCAIPNGEVCARLSPTTPVGFGGNSGNQFGRARFLLCSVRTFFLYEKMDRP